MKKLFCILMICTVLLTGCAKGGDQPPAELPDGNFDNSGERVVFYGGEQRFPLSFAVDGEQKLENGIYWYYELAEAYERNWEDLFYTYDVKKLELNGSKPYNKLKKNICFATNGNWPLFLNPVHTEYTASNQGMVDSNLIELTKRQLAANQMEGADAVVTDTWVCDMDGDKVQETIFKACSIKEEGAGYCFLAYCSGDSCQVLYGDFCPSGAPKVECLDPIVCDFDGDGKWSLMIYKKCAYESFMTYSFSGGNFTKCYEIIF